MENIFSSNRHSKPHFQLKNKQKIHTSVTVSNPFPQEEISETVRSVGAASLRRTHHVTFRLRHFLTVHCPVRVAQNSTRRLQTGCHQEGWPVYPVESGTDVLTVTNYCLHKCAEIVWKRGKLWSEQTQLGQCTHNSVVSGK